MDPLTAALNLATQLLVFADKVWTATPPAQQASGAANWQEFINNIGSVVLAIQTKINKL